MSKLRTLIEVMPNANRRDSVKVRRKVSPYRRDLSLLERCRNAWNSKQGIRETRERVMSYVFGDQWGDTIYYKGGEITERKYIQRQGNVPLTNNVMVSIQSSVVGLYAKQGTEPIAFARTHDSQGLSDMMSATLQANWQDTKNADVLKKAFEDYLDGGVAVTRETYEERDGLKDSWTDLINPNYAFWEAGSDPRMTDLRLIGVLHDVAPGKLYAKFCTKEFGLTIPEIDEIFSIDGEMKARFYSTSGNQQNDLNDLSNLSFDSPSDNSLCRLIEVWTKEVKPRYQCFDPLATNANDVEFRVELADIGHVRQMNMERKAQYDEAGVPEEQRAYITAREIVDEYWLYTFMAPDGTILYSAESPYDFRSHPFSIKLYPYINAEVHPFMANIIDQQRYINRLIVMHDMAARSSAKGVTIVPMECIPDGMTPQDFADEFTAYDGLIFYNTSRINPNARPQIITSNAVQIGTTELLQMQLNLARDITNVSGALQGKTPTAGTSASRYAQETQNATTSLFSILQDFTSLMESIAVKKCQIIKQFYPQGRPIINKDNTDVIEYDRLSARDVMFKISIKEAAATASFQQQVNDTAMQLLQLGAINVKQYLSSINLPFADSLLQQIESDEAAQLQMMQAQQMLQPETAQPSNVPQQ